MALRREIRRDLDAQTLGNDVEPVGMALGVALHAIPVSLENVLGQTRIGLCVELPTHHSSPKESPNRTLMEN